MSLKRKLPLLTLTLLCAMMVVAATSPGLPPFQQPVATQALRHEIAQFLGEELTAHIAAIKSLEPTPDQVLGAGTTGEYTWGTFMRSVAAYAEMSGQRTLAGRDLAKFVGQIGLVEQRLNSARFSQLYAAQALRHFGLDLKTNPLWQSLSEKERDDWRTLLNPLKFYDPKTRNVINLPENYLGVAARLAAIDYQLGLLNDRAMLDTLLDRAAHQFTGGALYADDAPPTGRFDRYSNEYARFIWEAAETAGRQDLLEAMRPTLMAQMRLWWDLVTPDGYGYGWGRSLGIVSYEDTMEIVGFLGAHPEFRPAPLKDLASAYNLAWRWLRRDYQNNTHLLAVFAFGRGNFAYISRDREWQQTTSFFGKTAAWHGALMATLEREGITQIPAQPTFHDVARFEFFRRDERQAGVWLVRQGPLRFTLPITTGTKPGVADYLPAPHSLPGYAAPVEQTYPALVPYLELSDGRVIVATDGADEITPAQDGRSLRVVWRKWALVGSKAGQFIDPHLTSEVSWKIEGAMLTRDETLTASEALTIRRWWVAVPTTAARLIPQTQEGQRWNRFESPDGVLEVLSPTADWPLAESLVATGDGPLGRGARGAVPLHWVFESRDVHLAANRPAHWRLSLRVASNR